MIGDEVAAEQDHRLWAASIRPEEITSLPDTLHRMLAELHRHEVK
ncbi:hypothetical protein [Streptantibioticus ferralitis]|uniref:Uncharacterized protein n=1 Tax=Streptantibioticus ferralitis TaxID=236510 RepID=A0ABT5YYZ8_9ACTN|nr:hypothetical protein [Streptantibioticus ferralitis]MDF2256637.1 hypothetical protein [Streptantibioticus ferralitis]